MSKQPSHKSFCSEPLMYFVNEYYDECPDHGSLTELLGDFVFRCISRPIDALYYEVESPAFAHEVQKMIDTYDWYITNRYWAFQFVYPVVSFLRVYYSIILHSSDVALYKEMLGAYVESLSGEFVFSEVLT